MGALLIKVLEHNRIYIFIKILFNEQPIYCFKFFFRYMYHYIQKELYLN